MALQIPLLQKIKPNVIAHGLVFPEPVQVAGHVRLCPLEGDAACFYLGILKRNAPEISINANASAKGQEVENVRFDNNTDKR
jgi:hypothetical protein